MWKNIGGGCMVVNGDPYPCDDEYENLENGARQTVLSKPEVHFNLPREVNDLSELATLGAVLKEEDEQAD